MDSKNTPIEPSVMAPPKDGDQSAMANWCLAWAKYAYAMYSGGLLDISPDGKISNGCDMTEMRRLAAGDIDVRYYQEKLDKKFTPVGDDNSDGWLNNISYEPVRLYPPYRERGIERIMSVRFDPNVNAIDAPSVRQKTLSYFRDRLASMSSVKQTMQVTGMIPDGVTQAGLTLDSEEIDALHSIGGYSLPVEAALGEAIQFTLQFSDFDPLIKRKLIEDLWDFNRYAFEVKYVDGDATQQIRYIDPRNLLLPYSQYEDCRDVTMAGYVSTKSLAEVRQESGFDEATMFDIARKSTRTNLNFGRFDAISAGTIASNTITPGVYRYDPMKVQVVTLYFVGCDVERYIAGIHVTNSAIFKRTSRTSKLNKSISGSEIKDYTTQYVYKVDWIVGTDYVYNFGIHAPTVREGRNGNMSAILPIVAWRGSGVSKSQQVAGTVEDINICIFRKRAALTKVPPPPNVSIDIEAIADSFSLGKDNISAKDMLEIYSIRGYLFHTSKRDWDNGANNPSPIRELPNTINSYLAAIWSDLEQCINMLRMQTGMNEITDGTSSGKGILNGVMEGANQSTNAALSILYTANECLYINMYKLLAKKYQALASMSPITLEYVPLRSSTVRVVNIPKDVSFMDFDITVTPAADQLLIQTMIASLSQYKQTREISTADEFFVMNLINSRQIKMAQYYLALAVERARKRAQEDAQANLVAQSQAQAESAVQAEEAKKQTEMAKLYGQLQLQDQKFKNQQELIRLQASLGVVQDSAKEQMAIIRQQQPLPQQ